MADLSGAEAEDQDVQGVYARMRRHGETFSEALASVGVPGTKAPLIRRRLAELGLLDATAEIAVDAVAALTRMLGDGNDHLADAIAALSRRQHGAMALANHYLRLAAKEHRNTGIEVLALDDSFRPRIEQVLDEFAELSRHDLSVMHPAAKWEGEFIEAGLRRDKQQIDRGVRLRTIHSQKGLWDPVMRKYLPRKLEIGCQIKAAPVVPVRMILFDREMAVIGVTEDPDTAAIVLRDPMLVRPMAALFDYCWMTASDVDDVPRNSDGTGLADQQRAVLRLLATGAKDESIARSLNVSVRTVTRVVAELTRELGATSRFQAGVQAAKLGWLD